MTREQFITRVNDSQKPVRRFLTALCCGDSQLADDIAQESFIKAYLSAGSLHDAERFLAWMLKIAHNTFLNYRRSARIHTGIDEAEGLDSHSRSDASFQYQELYQALSQIPESQRSAIVLYYIQGYSAKEIAEITATTDDNVRHQISRGRTHLRRLLSH